MTRVYKECEQDGRKIAEMYQKSLMIWIQINLRNDLGRALLGTTRYFQVLLINPHYERHNLTWHRFFFFFFFVIVLRELSVPRSYLQVIQQIKEAQSSCSSLFILSSIQGVVNCNQSTKFEFNYCNHQFIKRASW